MSAWPIAGFLGYVLYLFLTFNWFWPKSGQVYLILAKTPRKRLCHPADVVYECWWYDIKLSLKVQVQPTAWWAKWQTLKKWHTRYIPGTRYLVLYVSSQISHLLAQFWRSIVVRQQAAWYTGRENSITPLSFWFVAPWGADFSFPIRTVRSADGKSTTIILQLWTSTRYEIAHARFHVFFFREVLRTFALKILTLLPPHWAHRLLIPATRYILWWGLA